MRTQRFPHFLGGRAPRSGRGGRRFKSCHSDQFIKHLADPEKNRAQKIAQETYVLTSVIELAKRALLHCANHQSSMRPNWVRTRRQARQPAPSSAYNAGIKNTSTATASVCSIESGSPCGLMRRRSLRPQTYRLVAEFLAGRRKSPHKCDFREECGVESYPIFNWAKFLSALLRHDRHRHHGRRRQVGSLSPECPRAWRRDYEHRRA